MKYSELLAQIKELYPNEYTDTELSKWVDELNAMIADYQDETPKAYIAGGETPVGIPYDRMYIDFLIASISLYQHDDENYMRYIEQFNNKFSDWQKFYVRTNRGKNYRFKNWI